MTSTNDSAEFDTSSHRQFVDYYAKESLTESTRQRFEAIQNRVMRLVRCSPRLKIPLDVLDIGCGAGMQCMIWASAGNRAYGIDINASLVEIARQRAEATKLDVRFNVGSATSLPYDDASMDVCLMPELLEHIQDWNPCLDEATRVLRSGGILFVSTSNFLCPVQHEFSLAFYSWYPAPLKRHFEKLAVTTRPDIANYARYPAVNWFTYYGLARYLRRRGMSCLDRFDTIDTASPVKETIVLIIRRSRLLRFIGQVCTPGTIVFAVKQ
jgi:2-polyprenyl-3-methyl-5-hydroxy-6-metoxy-1,4-benzoquinol methylase